MPIPRNTFEIHSHGKSVLHLKFSPLWHLGIYWLDVSKRNRPTKHTLYAHFIMLPLLLAAQVHLQTSSSYTWYRAHKQQQHPFTD